MRHMINDTIAKLDISVPYQAAHIAMLQDLAQRYNRYSGEDFDLVSAAGRAIGQLKAPPYAEQSASKWVAFWAPKAKAQ